jgi:hypothetical protein
MKFFICQIVIGAPRIGERYNCSASVQHNLVIKLEDVASELRFKKEKPRIDPGFFAISV